MIVFDQVHRSFGTNQVLRGFSLQVPTGSTTALLGRSGSGKSVLLRLAVGLLAPDSGRVVVDDRTVADLGSDELASLRREIGFVFQFAALFDSMTCAQNLAMALRRTIDDPDQIAQRVAAALEMVGLPDVADRSPADLSGGMRKRVGISRAVVMRPRYILWDEPTTGLDPITTATMDELMIQVRNELGVTSLVVTHDLASAFRIADRVALLHEGSVRLVGTPGEVRGSTDPVVRQFVDGRPE
ncbi:MAG TPA: ATP-binding cassette domain-containing protein [Gemmatimonadales bacterium]|nr:ATP-binding cassette domain-containing protein [Gemmatimonadales bacterium]